MCTSEIVIPAILTRALDVLPELFSIQSHDGFILYANPALAKLCDLPSPRLMMARKDIDIPSRLYQDHDTLISWRVQDKTITEERTALATLEIPPDPAISPYLMQKKPFYNNQGECVAVFCSGKYLETFIPSPFIRGKITGSLLLTKPTPLFTEKECEIIFLKLQGLSSKETGAALSLSSRTVENRLATMYDKAAVNNFTDFRHFCEQLNLHRYLPRCISLSKIIGSRF